MLIKHGTEFTGVELPGSFSTKSTVYVTSSGSESDDNDGMDCDSDEDHDDDDYDGDFESGQAVETMANKRS